MDANGKDDLKTQFATREGIYRLMTLSEYSRPNRVGYQTNQSNPQVRVSLVSLPSAVPMTNNAALLQQQLMHHNNQQQQQQQSTTSSNASSVASQAGGLAGDRHQHPHQQQQHHHHHHQGTSSGLVQSPSLMTTLGNGGVQHTMMCDDSTMHSQSQYMQQQSSPTGGGGALMPLLQNGGAPSGGDRICFNYGKELYVYAYRGCKKLSADLSKPVDKKLYKGTNPSCHDFNETVAQCDGAPLLVGFTTGQIQLVQPGKREPGRLYNEERFIDKTKVTCLKWLPGSANHFLASHASGHLYLYNEDLPCTPSTPTYQPLRTGDGYTVHTSKAKQPRNPLHRWTFANSTATHGAAINEMAFSPCGQLLAIVSQDGFLRVFHYERQELLGVARSYFGGFLCVCWSPDGKYIVVGGEDDLVTVWSMAERRVVARGQGHRSWVSVVAFDPYTSYTASWDGPDFSDDENPANDGIGAYRCFTGSGATGEEPLLLRGADELGGGAGRRAPRPMSSSSTIPDKLGTSYRLGSVSQDTQLCLWDITEDVLRQSHEIRQRLGSHDPPVQLQGNGLGRTTVAGSPTDAAAADASGGETLTTSSTTADHSIHNHHNLIGNSTTGKATTLRSNSEQHSSGGKGSKHDGSSGSGGLTALTSLTQRLSNFSFGSDSKKSSDGATSHKKSFTLSKQSSSASANHHPHGGSFHAGGASSASPSSSSAVAPFLITSTPQKRGGGGASSTLDRTNSTFNNTSASSSGGVAATTSSSSSHASTASDAAAANSPTGSIVPSYDPMRLIGTAVCPRYDECPLLEPLVCKKIAHERLTALIFREDCFLTACQDGLIYTWARPGFSNLPQHIIPTATSPNAPSGGTVV